MKKITKLQASAATVGFAAMAAFAVVPGAFADSDTSSTDINGLLNSTISVTSGSSVALNVLPTSTGSITTNSDTVLVSTNNANGYTLTLSTSGATTALTGDVSAGTIPASAGTQTTPVSLAANTWGYRVDGVGGFGAGPTSVVTNQATESHTWAGVPASGAANTIKTYTTGAASNDSTTVWYALNATTAVAGDNYSNTVVYTAATR